MAYKKLKNIVIFLILSLSLGPNIHAQSNYKKTPNDSEGPFYPMERQSDEDNDLTIVDGKSKSARGDVLYLTGVVTNENGNPRSNVIIEIWQTDTNGLYRHPKDNAKGTRDPFFQYWGRAKTDKEGKYSFKTIIPGKYEPRPPHIHFKVWVDDKTVMTSQMYIAAGEYDSSNINELLKLNVTQNKEQEYYGFFRIVY